MWALLAARSALSKGAAKGQDLVAGFTPVQRKGN
jgi:hypothetical protein